MLNQRKKKMKTFKKHINENVNTSDTDIAVDKNDNMSEFSNPDVLRKLNAWVGSIAGSYVLPEEAVQNLRKSLMKIGLTFGEAVMEGNSGSVELPLTLYGGRFGKDAMDAVDTLYANARNNPIEDIESHLPLRVSRYELRDDSSSAGKWRGGIGSIREVTFLEDSFISIEGDGHAFNPWGYSGGKDGKPAEVRWHRTDGSEQKLPSMMPNRSVKSGESITLTGTCGGGYGNPLSRDPYKVAEDVADGFISKKTAKSQYGVVLKRDGILDMKSTRNSRKTLRADNKRSL